MTHAIIVVDVQNDFVEEGSLAVEGGRHLAEVIKNALIPSVRTASPDAPILYTKDWHINPEGHFSEEPDYVDTWPVHCLADTDGAEFAEDFPHEVDEVFRKGMYTAAYSGAEGVNIDGEGLVDFLKDRGITSVDVIGIAFDYCVAATALDLAAAGIETHIELAMTVSVHPENDHLTIAKLATSGVHVHV